MLTELARSGANREPRDGGQVGGRQADGTTLKGAKIRFCVLATLNDMKEPIRAEADA